MLNEVGRRLVLKFQTMETLYVAIVTGNIAEVRRLKIDRSLASSR